MVNDYKTLTRIKAGDTFSFTWSVPIAFGSLIPTLEARVNQPNGTKVEDLLVEFIADDADNRTWRLSATAEQTDIWPVKTLQFDIKHIAVDGAVVYTETLQLPVGRAETP